ncbi:oxidoreductase-like domain-containing protein [Vogesella sp. LIG4]|uniref:oxidoreductase-like domain-containing protein n=1 Tax=Vogesella sp. LIG4 TaxID=1192162 RepID=UPI00081FB851|nr:oxidoreductase-like domain-containing protein [Vogesella sp. LIG4]SCK17886.1 Oxidoreductase-like protein, N-terminal [Vogesella sp. LIG4]
MSEPLPVGDDDFDPMPEAPEVPSDDMCCGSGCDPCIWDIYNAAVQDYRRKLADWQAREAVRHTRQEG